MAFLDAPTTLVFMNGALVLAAVIIVIILLIYLFIRWYAINLFPDGSDT